MVSCSDSTIKFNTSALERIVNEPQKVLNEEQAFWTNEKAQIYTKNWAKHVNYEIQYDEWRESLLKWLEVPLEQRKSHMLMKMTQKIITNKQKFVEKALPFLCSYSPINIDYSITIHFTAFIPVNAFAMGEIVINVTASSWKENAANILNTLVHELYHICYSDCRQYHPQEKYSENLIYSFLDNIHNEGICTYIGYNALKMFPAPDMEDYQLLEDIDEVNKAFRVVNGIFSEISIQSEEEVRKKAWKEGVLGRAFYISGAFMCKVIEKKCGRKGLMDTIIKGPLAFAELYNSIAITKLQLKIEAINRV
ncbi:MAG: hypothetical protein EAX86_10900 [Candidatus Heimdallarchaeota archaeon]|nr:hypothetical protein [Candidatus Heimdallarchaeota archaeon]